MTIIDRQGEARTFHVKDTKKSTVLSAMRPIIDGYSVILTDDSSLYDDVHKHFWQHQSVRHKETFVRGIVLPTSPRATTACLSARSSAHITTSARSIFLAT